MSAEDLNSNASPVGTSWKLEYIVGGNVADTVYISVLADLDGDGFIGSSDITALGPISQNDSDALAQLFGNVELALAAFVNNYGTNPAAPDITTIGYIIRGDRTSADSFSEE